MRSAMSVWAIFNASAALAEAHAALAAAEAEVERLYARWAELEAKQESD